MASTTVPVTDVSTPGVARKPPAREPSKRSGKTKPPYPAEFKREAVRLMEQRSTSAAQRPVGTRRELGVSPDSPLLMEQAKRAKVQARCGA